MDEQYLPRNALIFFSGHKWVIQVNNFMPYKQGHEADATKHFYFSLPGTLIDEGKAVLD